MYVTAERGRPNDEIDQIYQGGGFSSTHVPWHGCPYSQEYISVAIHFSPAALVLLQMVFLLTDVILPHSRVTGITGKLSISLPHLSK